MILSQRTYTSSIGESWWNDIVHRTLLDFIKDYETGMQKIAICKYTED